MKSKENIRVITADASQNEVAIKHGLVALLLVGVIIVLLVSLGTMSGI